MGKLAAEMQKKIQSIKNNTLQNFLAEHLNSNANNLLDLFFCFETKSIVKNGKKFDKNYSEKEFLEEIKDSHWLVFLYSYAPISICTRLTTICLDEINVSTLIDWLQPAGILEELLEKLSAADKIAFCEWINRLDTNQIEKLFKKTNLANLITANSFVGDKILNVFTKIQPKNLLNFFKKNTLIDIFSQPISDDIVIKLLELLRQKFSSDELYRLFQGSMANKCNFFHVLFENYANNEIIIKKALELSATFTDKQLENLLTTKRTDKKKLNIPLAPAFRDNFEGVSLALLQLFQQRPALRHLLIDTQSSLKNYSPLTIAINRDDIQTILFLLSQPEAKKYYEQGLAIAKRYKKTELINIFQIYPILALLNEPSEETNKLEILDSFAT